MRSMPSMWRSRGCGIWRASRCRAKSACNGGARRSRGEREGEAAAHPVAAALRETLARYGFAARPLIELIDARTLRSLRRADGDGGRSGTLRHQDAIGDVRHGRRNSRRPARVPTELFTLDASIAYSIAGILHGLRTARCAPAALCAAGSPGPPSGRAGRYFRRRRARRCCAALAEMRELARRHLAAAQAKLESAPPEILPALLPAALVGPQLRRMERPVISHCSSNRSSPWRRQWLLWRAARDPSRIFRCRKSKSAATPLGRKRTAQNVGRQRP